MNPIYWNTLALLVGCALGALVWRGIREQQAREDRQAQEDGRII